MRKTSLLTICLVVCCFGISSNGFGQYNDWNQKEGHAVIWVSIPEIKGNDRGSFNVPGIVGAGKGFAPKSFIRSEATVDCLPKGNEDRSISAWMRTHDYSGSPSLAGWGKGGKYRLSRLALHAGVTKFHSNFPDNRGTIKIPQNEWHFVTITMSEGKVDFFVDGVKDCSKKLPVLQTHSPSFWHIGSEQVQSTKKGSRDSALETRADGLAKLLDKKTQPKDPTTECL